MLDLGHILAIGSGVLDLTHAFTGLMGGGLAVAIVQLIRSRKERGDAVADAAKAETAERIAVAERLAKAAQDQQIADNSKRLTQQQEEINDLRRKLDHAITEKHDCRKELAVITADRDRLKNENHDLLGRLSRGGGNP